MLTQASCGLFEQKLNGSEELRVVASVSLVERGWIDAASRNLQEICRLRSKGSHGVDLATERHSQYHDKNRVEVE